MTKDVIVALDFSTGQEALAFLDKFADEKPYVKIGMELFYGEGPSIVREVKARGHKLFLDLKLHDIPNTVEKAMANLARLGVDMTNVHAAGTAAMMTAALRGLAAGAKGEPPLLLAVTQLTSVGEGAMHDELLINAPMNDVIAHYAKNAAGVGLAGAVCSPLEAPVIHAACGGNFLTVTPGIRYPDDAKSDQMRVTSPADARALGSDYIVVGRVVNAAADPVAAYRRVKKDFCGA